VIGESLPVDALTRALMPLCEARRPAEGDAWRAAADAIRTTDTVPKGATARAELDGAQVVVNGIAKGSGMIAPDMATMLAFLFTDAALPAPVLQGLLADSVERSFNRITVDSDTSTSDTVLLFATGAAPGSDPAPADPGDPRLAGFRAALDRVTLDLAHQIVRDGEGATKFVAVTVTGAEDDAAAKRIALSIGNSPLVKTMLAAPDANWGRLVMAVGKAGEAADRDRLAIWLGGEQAAEGGRVRPGYSEARATEFLRRDEVSLRVDVGVGRGEATIWTCDLTHRYIDIIAGYRS
jgi:glutamate N-acetyltransferase/amino-acid N-acetyltransferase